MDQKVETNALAAGELQFAIVQRFHADDTDDVEYMIGTVRLMDGTELPFCYADGRFPTREGDVLRWDEAAEHPGNGNRGMSWPVAGTVVMIEPNDNRVYRWTLPGLILGGRVSDARYLQGPAYDQAVEFPGLHCVVAIAKYPLAAARDLVIEGEPHFPEWSVYIGCHADAFLAEATAPYAYAIYRWDTQVDESVLVGVTAKLA
jgi:hypothetical protein